MAYNNIISRAKIEALKGVPKVPIVTLLKGKNKGK